MHEKIASISKKGMSLLLAATMACSLSFAGLGSILPEQSAYAVSISSETITEDVDLTEDSTISHASGTDVHILDGVTVTVDNGATLTITENTHLYIDSGAYLNVTDGKLVVEHGAEVYIENGGRLNLANSHGANPLDIAEGTLHFEAGGTATAGEGNYWVGYLNDPGTWGMINLADGASLRTRGNDDPIYGGAASERSFDICGDAMVLGMPSMMGHDHVQVIDGTLTVGSPAVPTQLKGYYDNTDSDPTQGPVFDIDNLIVAEYSSVWMADGAQLNVSGSVTLPDAHEGYSPIIIGADQDGDECEGGSMTVPSIHNINKTASIKLGPSGKFTAEDLSISVPEELSSIVGEASETFKATVGPDGDLVQWPYESVDFEVTVTSELEGDWSIDAYIPAAEDTWTVTNEQNTFIFPSILANSYTDFIVTADRVGSYQFQIAIVYNGDTLATSNYGTLTVNPEPDTTAPTVTEVMPTGDDVPVNGVVSITFDEPMNPQTEGIVQLNGQTLTGAEWSAENTVLTMPYSGLQHSAEYTVSISGFADVAGNEMEADNSHIFSTAANIYDGRLVSISTALDSSKVLDIQGASVAAGAPALIWPLENGANQRFRIEASEDDTSYYAITSINSGYALSVSGANAVAGTAIVQLPYVGEDTQLWSIIEDGDNLAFVSKASETDAPLCIDVFGNSSANGTKLILWPYEQEKANQLFSLSDVARPEINDHPVWDGCYYLTAGTGLVLDVYGDSQEPGTALIGWNLKPELADNQRFFLSYDEQTGYYIITSLSSDLVLDAKGGGAKGTPVIQWEPKDSGIYNQRWSIEDAGNGQAIIRAASTHQVMDVFGNSSTPGASIIVWDDNGGDNQHWTLTPIE
ncbi:MAG: RICIN domain-containing protein [Coriobacteriales bacterium]|jgi:hypothetical protein|nr:RICIN domain-containing protein [Coriobacteriales bacterium]